MWKKAAYLAVSSSVLALVAYACSSSDTAPSSIRYTASMSAANERNADGTPKTINSSATGTANFTLTGDTLTYVINVAGLTSAAVASHIHVGSANQNGGIVTPFGINSGVSIGTLASGTIVMSKIVTGSSQVSGDSLLKLMNSGNAYVNVHTTTYGAGEMRGQVARQ